MRGVGVTLVPEEGCDRAPLGFERRLLTNRRLLDVDHRKEAEARRW